MLVHLWTTFIQCSLQELPRLGYRYNPNHANYATFCLVECGLILNHDRLVIEHTLW